MHTIKRALVVLVAMAVTVVGGLASPASAAARCNNWECDGNDPQYEGCNGDARTLEEFTINGVRTELRYSPSCYAAWTRYSHTGYWIAMEVSVEAWSSGVKVRRYYDLLSAGQTVSGWTDMVPFAWQVRSCLKQFSPVYEWCTGFH